MHGRVLVPGGFPQSPGTPLCRWSVVGSRGRSAVHPAVSRRLVLLSRQRHRHTLHRRLHVDCFLLPAGLANAAGSGPWLLRHTRRGRWRHAATGRPVQRPGCVPTRVVLPVGRAIAVSGRPVWRRRPADVCRPVHDVRGWQVRLSSAMSAAALGRDRASPPARALRVCLVCVCLL